MEIIFSGFAGIAVIGGLTMALVQVAKIAKTPKKLLPLFGVLIGVGLSFTANGASATATFIGLFASLSAMGLYSGTKSTLGK